MRSDSVSVAVTLSLRVGVAVRCCCSTRRIRGDGCMRLCLLSETRAKRLGRVQPLSGRVRASTVEERFPCALRFRWAVHPTNILRRIVVDSSRTWLEALPQKKLLRNRHTGNRLTGTLRDSESAANQARDFFCFGASRDGIFDSWQSTPLIQNICCGT